MMRKFAVLLVLLLFLLPAVHAEEALPVSWTLPEKFTAGTPDDAEDVAALLDVDAGELQTALGENDAVLFMATPGGSTVQLTVRKNDLDDFDFHTMGKKKVAILASSLAKANGENASVIKLKAAGQTTEAVEADGDAEEPEPTAEPGGKRCTMWIRMTPLEAVYPYTATWITERAGYELTVYVTWPDEEEETEYAAGVQDFLYSLMILPAA